MAAAEAKAAQDARLEKLEAEGGEPSGGEPEAAGTAAQKALDAGLSPDAVDAAGEAAGEAILAGKTPEEAAAVMAALTASTLVADLGVNLKSIKLTFGVGTRMAVPSNLPASSGKTRPTAFAAPVEVGIIELPAARPR